MTSVLRASRRATPTLERLQSGPPSWESQFRLRASLPVPLDSSSLEGQQNLTQDFVLKNAAERTSGGDTSPHYWLLPSASGQVATGK